MDFSHAPIWLIPLLIYFAKITEIALMSVRIIMIARGFRLASMLIAMAESLVWISILGLIVTNLDNLYNILAFVLGMGSGTTLGIFIEKRLALGLVIVRLIMQKPSHQLVAKLREIGFRVTTVAGESNYGKVQVLFAVVKRKNIKQFATIVRHFNPNAFFTIEDIREASQIIRSSSAFANLNTLVGNTEANNVESSAESFNNAKNRRSFKAPLSPKSNGRAKPYPPRNAKRYASANRSKSSSKGPSKAPSKRSPAGRLKSRKPKNARSSSEL